ncbi:MAG: YihY/virulence factor BrkB family protein [Acidimicrobiia bacterium]
MSTASVVPETRDLGGDDAWRVLRRRPIKETVVESVMRFRWADGFSSSRALAFQIVLALVPAVVLFVGLAELVGNHAFAETVQNVIASLVPGAADSVIFDAARQGATAANNRRDLVALLSGFVAVVVSGTTGFGQIERGANRIYGVEKDRPFARKYSVALGMAASSGVLLLSGFVLLAVGRSLGGRVDSSSMRTLWSFGRWPVGAVALTLAYAIMFRVSPRRKQPSLSWLAFGAGSAVALNVVLSLALSLYLKVSGGFGRTYGPLAGLLGVMVWAYAVSIGLFLGVAFAAQLEAVRAGQSEPQSDEKVDRTEPTSETTPQTDRPDEHSPFVEAMLER